MLSVLSHLEAWNIYKKKKSKSPKEFTNLDSSQTQQRVKQADGRIRARIRSKFLLLSSSHSVTPAYCHPLITAESQVLVVTNTVKCHAFAKRSELPKCKHS